MKTKTIHIALLFTFLTKLAFSQVNLVPNGSFEEYKMLPDRLLTNGQNPINKYLLGWSAPYSGISPDYYNYLSPIIEYQYPNIMYTGSFWRISSDSIRKNITPLSGDAFIGIFNRKINSKIDGYDNFYYIESVYGELISKLIKNRKYEGAFFFNNFGLQSLIIADLGMIIIEDTSTLKYKYTGSWIPMPYGNKPQIMQSHGLIKNDNQWKQVSNIFKAKGNENQIIISYFKNDSSLELLDSSNAVIELNVERYSFQNYFYIDSVTLYEIPCLVAQDSACKGDSISFYHTFSGKTIWTTNADSTQEVIGIDSVYRFMANQSGWYYVFTSTGKDSTYLTVIETPTVDLGADTFVCEKRTIQLTPTYTNTSAFEWQNGTIQPTLQASKQGWYWVKATNAGCSKVDSIYVTEQPLPDKLTQHQLTICTVTQQYATLALNTNYIYYWQTLTDTFNQITFTQAGCEKVSIESEYGCLNDDEVCIEDVCGAKVFVPNAFVPEGVNSTFKPVTKYVSSLHWEVYNRWGERVFAADDLDASWDGTFNGALCNSDVYFYKVTYTDLINSQKQTIKGNVTLLR